MTSVLRCLLASVLVSVAVLSVARAADPAKATANLTGKIFVVDTKGEVLHNDGTQIEPLEPRGNFVGQGSIVESVNDGLCVLVFSNGTGVHCAQQTRFEVKRFTQEPFVVNRQNVEAEPSVSNTP